MLSKYIFGKGFKISIYAITIYLPINCQEKNNLFKFSHLFYIMVNVWVPIRTDSDPNPNRYRADKSKNKDFKITVLSVSEPDKKTDNPIPKRFHHRVVQKTKGVFKSMFT